MRKRKSAVAISFFENMTQVWNRFSIDEQYFFVQIIMLKNVKLHDRFTL